MKETYTKVNHNKTTYYFLNPLQDNIKGFLKDKDYFAMAQLAHVYFSEEISNMVKDRYYGGLEGRYDSVLNVTETVYLN